MAYYGGVGDYYRGDYYYGDPGGIKSLIKRAAGSKLVRRFVKPIAKMIPGVGTVVGIAGAGATIAGAVRPPARPAPPGQIKVPGMRGTIERILPGGETGYYRRRRMNPTNPKALRRALRRVTGFAKLAQRTKRDIGRAATAAGVRRGAAKKGRRR